MSHPRDERNIGRWNVSHAPWGRGHVPPLYKPWKLLLHSTPQELWVWLTMKRVRSNSTRGRRWVHAMVHGMWRELPRKMSRIGRSHVRWTGHGRMTWGWSHVSRRRCTPMTWREDNVTWGRGHVSWGDSGRGHIWSVGSVVVGRREGARLQGRTFCQCSLQVSQTDDLWPRGDGRHLGLQWETVCVTLSPSKSARRLTKPHIVWSTGKFGWAPNRTSHLLLDNNTSNQKTKTCDLL